ncbi:MAG: tetratricopeptide repeat protein [Fuerstiella sp.]|nr:tetratricopeptide repeat protein [Fuerstiella sp.]
MKPVCRMESAAKRILRARGIWQRRFLSFVWVAAVGFWSLTVVGCQTMAGQKEGGVFASATAPVVKAVRNLWNGSGDDRDNSALARGSRFSEEGRQSVQQTKQLFDSGDYEGAAKQYGKLAEKYKGTSAGEEAQFRMAESWYALERYPVAQDGYDQLFVDYPSTRFVQTATKRMYRIAQVWLDLADPLNRSRIRTVSAVEVEYEHPNDAPPVPTAPSLKYRILPNFADRSRPVFDTQGRALKALKGIWLNDPTGPLADDALFATASYYLRREDYVEADRYFNILRDEYPDSPHIKDAFLLGSHVRLMSYQGPSYDGTSLEGAGRLTAQSLKMFPGSSERAQLRKDLQKIHLLKAQRIWDRIQYYEKKNNSDRAVGLTCVQLMNEFPNTQFADMARDKLATLDRNELQVLPGFDRILESLSPAPLPAERLNGQVKSVGATADETAGSGQL